MYGNKTPIREDLLERSWPLLEKYRNGLIVRDWDFVLRSWQQPTTNGLLEINAWALIVLANGAILGPENYISFVWTFGVSPQVPSDTDLDTAIQQTLTRIRVMMREQLIRKNAGESPN